MSERREKVSSFEAACRDAGMTELAPYVFELGSGFQKTLTICTLIHGNEIGGIEVLLRIIAEIKTGNITPRSRLHFILGNVPAYLADKRFIESDMNRSFALVNPVTSEERRAAELEEFLAASDVLIDIHQTIGPTSTPFFIFEYEKCSYDLARYLGPTLPIVTYRTKRGFKGKTSTGFTMSKGGMGITIETGQKSISDTQISLGMSLVRKAIETDFTGKLPAAPLSGTYTFSQIIDNPDGSLEMKRTYSNFEAVKKGEHLAGNSDKNIFCEQDGVILFPKYGEYAKKSAELALLLKPVSHEKDLE